jgi:hypothetical protein
MPLPQPISRMLERLCGLLDIAEVVRGRFASGRPQYRPAATVPRLAEWYAQMAVSLRSTLKRNGVGLPACDRAALQRRLPPRDEYRVEVSAIKWGGPQVARVPVQG